MMPDPFDDPQHCVRAHAMGEKAFDHLRTTLAQCAERQLIEVADIEATAQSIWAASHGLTSLLIAHPRFAWVERDHLIDTLLDNIISGLRAGRGVLAGG